MYKIKKKRVKKITQKLKAASGGDNKNESGTRFKQPSDAELEEGSNDNHNGTSNAKNVATSNATDGHEPNFSWNGVIQLLEEYQGNENVSSKPKNAITSTTAPGMHTNSPHLICPLIFNESNLEMV